jgi:hypothetical protein
MHLVKDPIIIHGNGNLLIGPQIPFGRLDGRAPQQKFDLLQIPSALPAELGAGPAEIMSAEVFDPDLLG